LDASFFGKRQDKFGLIVAKDVRTGTPVSYHFIQHETLKEYQRLHEDIEAMEYKILSVTIDGKRGLFGLFEPIPVQMCHFHQQAILTRYLTKNPQSNAAMDLKRIASCLGKVNAKRFTCLLSSWYKRHSDFYHEKVQDDTKKGWHYKHKRLRSAYRSLQRHLPYLFTYKKYPELSLPNTTNALDGGLFSPLKDLLKVHRGIGIEMKKKIITDYLEKLVK